MEGQRECPSGPKRGQVAARQVELRVLRAELDGRSQEASCFTCTIIVHFLGPVSSLNIGLP